MAFSVSDLNDEKQLARKLLFTPCSSKAGLRRWLRVYLKVDFPDIKVEPESTGSPMDTLWEIYSSGITNDPNSPGRFLWYASRDSAKTLSASALEVLGMIHMKRSVVHLAAILQQSEKAAEYYKSFLDMDGLVEFKIGDNKRTVAVCWFEHLPTGNILTLKEWKDLGGRENRGQYRRYSYYIKIIVNSARSANSDHCAMLVCDEIDLIQYPKAYREALFIPTTIKDQDGNCQPPITILTSSRKYAGGLVQEEIDKSDETGTVVRHHNILDVTAKCPDERFCPEKPKLNVYRSSETLKTILPDEYANLCISDPKLSETYIIDEAYHGCYHNCKIFAGCRGLLAKQTCNAGFLKPVYDTVRKWKQIGDIEMVKAQLLCLKPGNEGAIYSHFSRNNNMLSLNQMWAEVTGNEPGRLITKKELIDMFIDRGYSASGGMDFGFAHCFAVVIGFVVGHRIYIIDAFEIPGLELHQCVDICDRRIKHLNPLLWPDTAYPAYIKTFRSAGYRCRKHKKDVIGGIDAVRKKMAPAGLIPELYLIRNDDGCELLAKRIEGYRWMEDSLGRATDVPKDIDDDLNDALRYLIQNTFDKSGIILAKDIKASVKDTAPLTHSRQMAEKIYEATGGENNFNSTIPVISITYPGATSKKIFKKNGFYADFS